MSGEDAVLMGNCIVTHIHVGNPSVNVRLLQIRNVRFILCLIDRLQVSSKPSITDLIRMPSNFEHFEEKCIAEFL